MFKKLICSIFGHKFKIVKTFYPGNRKVYCTRCKQYFGMHDDTQSFISWDLELEDASKWF